MSEEEAEEWLPEKTTRGRGRMKKGETTEKKPVTKPKEPKPKAERKPRAPRALKVKKSVEKEKDNAGFQQDEAPAQVQVKEEVRLPFPV